MTSLGSRSMTSRRVSSHAFATTEDKRQKISHFDVIHWRCYDITGTDPAFLRNKSAGVGLEGGIESDHKGLSHGADLRDARCCPTFDLTRIKSTPGQVGSCQIWKVLLDELQRHLSIGKHFPGNSWNKTTVNNLIRKIWEIGWRKRNLEVADEHNFQYRIM